MMDEKKKVKAIEKINLKINSRKELLEELEGLKITKSLKEFLKKLVR